MSPLFQTDPTKQITFLSRKQMKFEHNQSDLSKQPNFIRSNGIGYRRTFENKKQFINHFLQLTQKIES